MLATALPSMRNTEKRCSLKMYYSKSTNYPTKMEDPTLHKFLNNCYYTTLLVQFCLSPYLYSYVLVQYRSSLRYISPPSSVSDFKTGFSKYTCDCTEPGPIRILATLQDLYHANGQALFRAHHWSWWSRVHLLSGRVEVQQLSVFHGSGPDTSRRLQKV